MFADFGKEAACYAAGRRGYPQTVFFYLKVYAKLEDPILDLGCGTGIATRQLVLAGFEEVQGVDSDPRMIAIAQEHRDGKHISYWCSPINKISFHHHAFKVLTAFSSFHWFQDKESLAVLHRVLKDKGVLFICRKEDLKGENLWIKEARLALEKASGQKGIIPRFIEAKKVLEENPFSILSEKKFPGEDLYSVDGAKDYIRSLSHWSLIEEANKDEVMSGLIQPILEKYAVRGALIRKYNADVIVAQKI